MPLTHGLTHIAIAVRDPARSFAFYRDVFGMVAVYESPDFVQAQTPGSRDVLVFERSSSPAGNTGDIAHIGFRLTSPTSLAAAVAAVERAGGQLIEQGEFCPGEPYAFVHDTDGHVVEIWFEIPTPLDPPHHPRPVPSDIPVWDQYPETILEFFTTEGGIALRIDLREPIAPAQIEGLGGIGLREPFGIVTAAAPIGVERSDALDRLREQDLEAVVRHSRKASVVRVDGVSPDGAHRERSIAVVLPQPEVVGLARDFHQAAIFWFDGRRFSIVGALVDADSIPLP